LPEPQVPWSQVVVAGATPPLVGAFDGVDPVDDEEQPPDPPDTVLGMMPSAA